MSDEVAAIYNGKPYDASIDWNDPIILYNEDGTVKYDPSDPDFKDKQKEQMEESSDSGDEAESENTSKVTITPREEAENDTD